MNNALTDNKRREYIRAAKELKYPRAIIQGLKEAKTISECERLMFKGRHTY